MNGYERETIILFNEAEDTAEVYTHNRKMMNQLDKLCKDFPDDFREETKDEFSKTYIVPKQNITIRKPSVISKEGKRKLRERGKTLQKARAKA